jgi:hypothetical protein
MNFPIKSNSLERMKGRIQGDDFFLQVVEKIPAQYSFGGTAHFPVPDDNAVGYCKGIIPPAGILGMQAQYGGHKESTFGFTDTIMQVFRFASL